ncbi:MAG: winged helix-turn-helix domain-containing protein [Halioglobus sp.]|nr:winged helix-turn-helix domain-containing protein [Halioglobus sp.]MCB1730322.1 winged helix-turn-helix domain-containing protein [Halieaceae bacterium]
MVRFRIGTVDFLPESYEVMVAGKPEHMQPQVRNVLLCLVCKRGEVVSRETLMREAWHGRHATDECLTRCIYLLRKQLRDNGLLETVPRIGYRLHNQGHADGPAPPAVKEDPGKCERQPPGSSWFC